MLKFIRYTVFFILIQLPMHAMGFTTEFDVSLFRPSIETFYSGTPPVDLTDTAGDTYGSATFGLNAQIPLGKAHVEISSGFSGYQWILNSSLQRTDTELSFASEEPSFLSGGISAMGIFLSKHKNLYICSFGFSFSEDRAVDERPSFSFTGIGAGTMKISDSTHLIYGGIATNGFGRPLVIPGIGFYSRLSEKHSFMALLPVFYQFSYKKDSRTEVTLYLKAFGQSSRFYNNGEFAGQPEIVRMTETSGKTGMGFRFSPSANSTLSIDLGLSFLRRLSFSDEEDSFFNSEIRGYAFGRIGFRWKFGKSLTSEWLNI